MNIEGRKVRVNRDINRHFPKGTIATVLKVIKNRGIPDEYNIANTKGRTYWVYATSISEPFGKPMKHINITDEIGAVLTSKGLRTRDGFISWGELRDIEKSIKTIDGNVDEVNGYDLENIEEDSFSLGCQTINKDIFDDIRALRKA